MSSILEQAFADAEARKNAAVGERSGAEAVQPTKLQRRAVFSGFDIDGEELDNMIERCGYFFAGFASSAPVPLHEAFATCWADALLLGMMIGKISKSSQ